MRENRMVIATTALLMVLAACGSPSGEGPGRNDSTSTTGVTTTVPSTTSTSVSSVVDEAGGSGCTPGPGQLPDGEWFGYAVAITPDEIEFDLACWFSGDAAATAASEDGEESPPPNDYYIRNTNDLTRPLRVSDTAEVVWYPQVGDPSSETTTAYEDWVSQINERGFMLGIWVEVEGGRVVEVEEQWVP